jgi:hypothetical protein
MEKGLTVKDVLKLFKKFREKHINFFIKRKVINYPIKERDLEILDAIHKIWGTKEIVRFNLSFFDKEERDEIYRQVVLKYETKLDIWLYSRMKNKMEHGEKLDVKELIDEVVRVFKLKKDKKHLDALKQRIIKIRYRLYYERRKQKKKSFL